MLLLDKYLRIGKLALVSLFLFKNIVTAQNLVRNGSFENYNTPINWNLWGGDFIGYYSSPPDTVMIDWKAINSPDYFNSACTHTYTGVPVNRFGSSYSKNGNNYIGIGVYVSDNDYKEYVYQKLTAPLQAGKIYCLSFYVSRADRSTFAIKTVGAYFSNTIQSNGTLGYINALPNVVSQSGFITDTTSWIEIQGCFTANGGEQYITIGNFNSNLNTDTLHVVSTNPMISGSGTEISYYYLDDITLIDQTTVGLENMNYELGVMNVYPNPANDILNIDIKNFNKENLSVNIFDVIGKEVLKSDYKNQIDVSFLEKGIYFVSIQQDRKTLGVKKIIKE